jgi:hypothetical protein
MNKTRERTNLFLGLCKIILRYKRKVINQELTMLKPIEKKNLPLSRQIKGIK